MKLISQDKALILLEDLKRRLEKIDPNALKTEYVRWHKLAQERIGNIFGADSRQIADFIKTRFAPYDGIENWEDEPDLHQDFWEQIDEVQTQVMVLKDEIEHFWPLHGVLSNAHAQAGNELPVKESLPKNKLFLSTKLSFDGIKDAKRKVNYQARKYGLNPKKDIIQVKIATKPVTQEVIDKVKICKYMLQIYEADSKEEPFTWLFFEYAIARTLEIKTVRIVEKRFLKKIAVDRDYYLISFDRSSRERFPIQKAIGEAFEQLFREE